MDHILFSSWAEARDFMAAHAAQLRAFRPVMRRNGVSRVNATPDGFEVAFATPLPIDLALRVMDWVA